MKRAWSKMSRVISALLVLGMFASVVPAQALAVEEEETAVVVEQQEEEQTEVQEPVVEKQEEGETMPDEQPQNEVAGDQNAEVYSDAAGTPSMLSDSRSFDCKNIFVNMTEDEHVHVYYSTDGVELKEIGRGPENSITTDIVTEFSDFVGIEFYIAVDEGYVYKGTSFCGDTDDTVKPIGEYYDELKKLDNDAIIPFHYRSVDFTTAIATAQETYNATYAFMYSGIGGLGLTHAAKRAFSVCVERDPAYTEITYQNTKTQAVESVFVKMDAETTLWDGVNEDAGLDWTKDASEHEVLAGWEDANGEKYELEGKIIPTQTEMTLYTVWEPAQYQYTVEYYYNGVLGEAPEGAEVGGTAEYDDTVTIEPQKIVVLQGEDGFVTYTLNAEESELSKIISDDKAENVLKVYYKTLSDPDEDKYVYLTFNAGEHGKIVNEDGSGANLRTDRLLPGNDYPAAPNVEPETGWMFIGWFENGDPEGTKYEATGKVTDESESVTYKAVYEEERDDDETPTVTLTSYTVRYLEDGTGYEVASPKTVSDVTVGTTVTETAPDIAGYSLMSPNPQQWTIRNGENIITFYYRAVGPDQPAVVTPSETPAAVAPVTPVIPRTTTTTTTVTTPTATPAPDAGDTDEEEAEEEEVIEEEETPLTEEPAEEETITDEETPLAESASGWALLNLILAIVTVIGAVVLVIGYFAGYQTIWRLLSLIPAIGGVVAFFLTEDMSLPMAFVDSWTLLMVIIAVVQVVIAIMAMKDKEDDEEA